MTVEFNQMFDFIRWMEEQKYVCLKNGSWQNPNRYADDREPLTDLELYNLYLKGTE